MTKGKLIIFVLLITGLALTACAGNTTLASESSDSVDTQVPIAIAESRIISDGNLVPRDFVDLAFAAGGEVAEVLVEEGGEVATGDVMARLSGREQLEAGVAAARLEVQAAQNDLLSAEIARQTLDDDLLMAQTETLDAITLHKEAVRTFERRVRSLSSTADHYDIDEAKSTVILAEDALEKAEARHHRAVPASGISGPAGLAMSGHGARAEFFSAAFPPPESRCSFR